MRKSVGLHSRASVRNDCAQIVRLSATIQLQEDHFRWDKPNRRFCLLEQKLEQGTLFDVTLTRLQIQEVRVDQGWSLILTVETNDLEGLGVVDLWTRTGQQPDGL